MYFHSKSWSQFCLNGYVNKQNCNIWSEDNPLAFVKTPLHPLKITVWCTLLPGGIIGTVTGERYRDMIRIFFLPQLAAINIADMWFQQTGWSNMPHSGRYNWFTQGNFWWRNDFTQWSYWIIVFGVFLKSLVYVDKPEIIKHLKYSLKIVKICVQIAYSMRQPYVIYICKYDFGNVANI